MARSLNTVPDCSPTEPCRPDLMEEQAVRPAESQDDAAVKLQDKRVLVVDDNPAGRKVLCSLLKSWRCRCQEAEDLQQTLSELSKAFEAQDPYHVTIMDKTMPDGEACDLAKTIKADSKFEGTALVMVSTGTPEKDISETAPPVFAAHLTKPVNRSQLFRCLTTALGNEVKAPNGEPQDGHDLPVQTPPDGLLLA